MRGGSKALKDVSGLARSLEVDTDDCDIVYCSGGGAPNNTGLLCSERLEPESVEAVRADIDRDIG